MQNIHKVILVTAVVSHYSTTAVQSYLHSICFDCPYGAILMDMRTPTGTSGWARQVRKAGGQDHWYLKSSMCSLTEIDREKEKAIKCIKLNSMMKQKCHPELHSNEKAHL